MSDAILETRNLSKRFGALVASDDISLSLMPGEIHALIGPNGAGKSTLIAQISGALRPDEGRIFLDRQEITHVSMPKRARRGLGRSFQISELALDDSVLENAMLGAIGATGSAFSLFRPALKTDDLRQRAEEALFRVGLKDQMQSRASELSHGQRRQLEVAIALTLKPKAFVMDEPMAGLGAEGSKTMVGFLDGLRQEAPILLVEHDMDAVFALADRVSVLVYGKIIATGTVQDIRANPDVRAAYLGDME